MLCTISPAIASQLWDGSDAAGSHTRMAKHRQYSGGCGVDNLNASGRAAQKKIEPVMYEEYGERYVHVVRDIVGMRLREVRQAVAVKSVAQVADYNDLAIGGQCRTPTVDKINERLVV